jgi:site-specific recombinase XerD
VGSSPLTYSVGLRVSEVINLKIEDIDSKRMIIHIKNAKGRKDRIVPLSENILKLLRGYFLKYKPKTYLFNGQKSIIYSSGSCNKIVKKYLGEKYHIHQLRHSCFTYLLECGVGLRIIQKIAGHSSSKTTEIYTHVSNQMLNKIKLPI